MTWVKGLQKAVLVGLALGHVHAPAAYARDTASPCPAPHQRIDLVTAIERGDVTALLQLALDEAGAEHDRLAQGLADSLLLRDRSAVEHLRAYLGQATGGSRAEALTALGGVELRRGQYRQAAQALRGAVDLAPPEDQGSGRLIALRQTAAVAEALADEPAQTDPVAPRGVVAIHRDLAKLPLADLLINGRSQAAIVDTGANLSVVSLSKALELGLRILPASIEVASPVSAATAAQLAVADSLNIGGAEFGDVVFLVLPDAALTFAGGAYKIDAILGFPILSRLGRLSFESSGAAENLRFDPGDAGADPEPANLVVELFTPKILACSAPEGRVLQFALDSGAQTTSLRPLFATEYPHIVEGVASDVVSLGGAGGVVERAALTLPSFSFLIGPTTVVLSNVTVSEESAEEPGDHGRLGQDALMFTGGYVVDFTRMRFELREPPEASSTDAPVPGTR